MSKKHTYKSGDQVVYPSHGVGKVVGQETQEIAGHEIKCYVIEFEKDKMTLRVPVNRCEEAGLRALSGTEIIDAAIKALKGRAKPGRGMWSRRAQEYEGKINSGDIMNVAHVVRDLSKNVDHPDRSYSERVIYEAALERLAGEYAAVYNVTLEAAIETVEKTLKNSRKQQAEAEEQDDNVVSLKIVDIDESDIEDEETLQAA